MEGRGANDIWWGETKGAVTASNARGSLRNEDLSSPKC